MRDEVCLTKKEYLEILKTIDLWLPFYTKVEA